MNKSIFCGNLTKDFEANTSTNGTKVAKSGMALNRGKDKDGNDRGADFINLVAFGKTADFLEKYGTKGRKFLIECHVQTGSYEKDGRKVYTTDFVIDRAEFCDSKAEQSQAQPQSDDFMSTAGLEDELPFV